MWLLRPGLPRLQEERGRKVTLRAGQTGDRGAVTAPLEGHYGEQGEDCSVTPTIRAAWQHSWWMARWHAGQAGRAVRGWGGPALQIQRCLLDPAASHQDPEEPEKNSGKTWAAGTLGCLGLNLPPGSLPQLAPSSPQPRASSGAELPRPSGPQTPTLDWAAHPPMGVPPLLPGPGNALHACSYLAHTFTVVPNCLSLAAKSSMIGWCQQLYENILLL